MRSPSNALCRGDLLDLANTIDRSCGHRWMKRDTGVLGEILMISNRVGGDSFTPMSKIRVSIDSSMVDSGVTWFAWFSVPLVQNRKPVVLKLSSIEPLGFGRD